MNNPQIRFKEYILDWQEKELSKVVNFFKGNLLSKADLCSDGKYPCILYGQLYTTYNEIASDIIYSTNRSDNNIPRSKIGDVLIPSSGESPLEISTSTCILKDNILLGGDLNVLRPKDIDGRFLSYVLNHVKKIDIAKVSQGHSVVHLYNDSLKKIKINIPEIKEQEKISDFLELIDNRIDKQNKMIKNLELLLKGLVEKEFEKKYNKVSLKKILKERKIYSEKGLEYPHVTLSKDGIYDKGERYNRDFLVTTDDKAYKITKKYDLCYNPANLKFGVICLNEYGNAIFSPIYVTFEIDKNVNPYYIKYYTCRNNFINSVRKYEQGTVYERMSVSPEDFLKFEIDLPTREIQDNIVNNLNKIENKIKLEKKKLEDLMNFKIGLIQNMII